MGEAESALCGFAAAESAFLGEERDGSENPSFFQQKIMGNSFRVPSVDVHLGIQSGHGVGIDGTVQQGEDIRQFRVLLQNDLCIV